MIIRQTIKGDIPNLAAIVSKNYSKLTAEYFCSEIDCSLGAYPFKPTFYTGLNYEEIIGCAGYVANWLAYGSFSLSWVNIKSSEQNKGYGKKLVQQCIDDLVPIASLILLSTDVPAFYSKNWGFKILDKTDTKMGNILMGLNIK